MALYKRGDVYWYEFEFKGERIRDSTHTSNKEAAKTIEADARVKRAKGEVGIKDRKKAPTLAEFAPRFETAIETLCAEKPETVGFYKAKLRRLLGDAKLAGLRLSAIDKAAIQGYKERRTRTASRYGAPMSPASVNRELATLRRLLRLAQEWGVIEAAPRIKMLGGERVRDYVISHSAEPKYLAAAPQPLKDVALLMLDTGLRVGEAVGLNWPDIHLQAAVRAKFGYLRVRDGKSKNAKRNISLTARAASMLKARKAGSQSAWVFPGETDAAAILGTSLDHQHEGVRDALKLPKDFVIHSLRHTMLTRLGEAGADAFTIMRIAGHSSVTVSQRYVHPTPEGLERAFERLESLNATKFEEAEIEAKANGTTGGNAPTISPTPEKRRLRNSPQVVEFKQTGP